MIFQLFDFQPALNVQFNPFPLRDLFPYIEEIQIPLKAKGLIIDMSVKNDDSVKEAPAYCRNFLDGLYTCKGGGQKSSFCHFLMFCNILQGFIKFCNFWGGQTNQPTDRQKDRQT